jgi:hypothetical protein
MKRKRRLESEVLPVYCVDYKETGEVYEMEVISEVDGNRCRPRIFFIIYNGQRIAFRLPDPHPTWYPLVSGFHVADEAAGLHVYRVTAAEQRKSLH